MRIKDNVVIITGSGSGIGKETALLFAREGGKLVVADVNDKAGEETAERDKERQEEMPIFAHLDVSNREQVKQVVKDTISKYGRIDVLIN